MKYLPAYYSTLVTSNYSKKTEYKLSVLDRADIQRLARARVQGSRIARDKRENSSRLY